MNDAQNCTGSDPETVTFIRDVTNSHAQNISCTKSSVFDASNGASIHEEAKRSASLGMKKQKLLKSSHDGAESPDYFQAPDGVWLKRSTETARKFKHKMTEIDQQRRMTNNSAFIESTSVNKYDESTSSVDLTDDQVSQMQYGLLARSMLPKSFIDNSRMSANIVSSDKGGLIVIENEQSQGSNRDLVRSQSGLDSKVNPFARSEESDSS